MQKYNIGDVVMRNDLPLEPGDQHEALTPGLVGSIIEVWDCGETGFRYMIRRESSQMPAYGWWVCEANLDPATPVAPIDLETLL